MLPAQPGADQTVRQAQLGRHLRHRAATTNRSNRFALERLRKAPAPFRILGHHHLQALQPIRGVHSSGASPVRIHLFAVVWTGDGCATLLVGRTVGIMTADATVTLALLRATLAVSLAGSTQWQADRSAN